MKKKVILVRSTISCLPKQRATAKSLGLKKIGDSAIFEDDAVLEGKIKVVSHLVKVENV